MTPAEQAQNTLTAAGITPSQADALRFAARGRTVKQHAKETGLTAETIKSYRAAITRKLGRNMCAACALAGAAGLV